MRHVRSVVYKDGAQGVRSGSVVFLGDSLIACWGSLIVRVRLSVTTYLFEPLASKLMVNKKIISSIKCLLYTRHYSMTSISFDFSFRPNKNFMKYYFSLIDMWGNWCIKSLNNCPKHTNL